MLWVAWKIVIFDHFLRDVKFGTSCLVTLYMPPYVLLTTEKVKIHPLEDQALGHFPNSLCVTLISSIPVHNGLKYLTAVVSSKWANRGRNQTRTTSSGKPD